MGKTRRGNAKYPGLDKKYNLKIRQELIDQDYIDKLTDEEKDWLSRFNEEYVSANFQHKGKKLHKTKKQKRERYQANNKRNVDIFAVSKANEMLRGEKDIKSVLDKSDTNASQHEDTMIALIDMKKNIKVK